MALLSEEQIARLSEPIVPKVLPIQVINLFNQLQKMKGMVYL
jgi:hypothetical protein